MKKSKQGVIDAISDPRLTELVKCDGYHYFIFDDGDFYATESVYVMYFHSMAIERWLEKGRTFLAKAIEDAAEAKATPLPTMFVIK
jgi:hypothetical protein